MADIDCSGLACPGPVLETRKHLEGASAPFTVLVDNLTARDNVSKFARSSGCVVGVTEEAGGYLLTVTPPAGLESSELPGVEATACVPGVRKKVVVISSDEIGTGERELGTTLMKMFLYTATHGAEHLSTVIFINTGVRLLTENEETAAHVIELEKAGTEVLACGTCLDYYGLKDALRAGRASNMYEIQSAMLGADLLVSL
jgi:selenium metabolism protein YedF